MAPPSDGSPADPAPPDPLLGRTASHLDRLLALALVPLATSLLDVGDLLATARGRGLSITASVPVYRYDLWSFVDAPDDGGVSVDVPFGTVEPLALAVPLLAGYLAVSGALSAGYFGSIADGITRGSFDFAANVRRFAIRMIALEVLFVAALLGVFLPLVVVPPLFLLAVVALLFAAYLLFPTVYVLVLEDRGIEAAARRAYGLVAEHRPVGFFVSLVAATAICSVVLSYLAYSGIVGAVVAVIVAAPVALAFNVATTLKVAEMADIDVVE